MRCRRRDATVEFATAIGAATLPDTTFRSWMNGLREDVGPRPEWPVLLSWMLETEFERQRQVDRPYSGLRILIDRTRHEFNVKVPEKRAVYGLCHRCWQETNGCLLIDGTPVWLLSYEVPNQADENGRRADLVGLTQTGGLVVFEGKLGSNSCPPISAVLEGLDYLSCLTSAGTFERVISEFRDLKQRIPVPAGFEGIEPNLAAPPAVIVLADSEYFNYHDRSERSPGWRELVKHGRRPTSISMRFAQAESDIDGFFSRTASWLT